MIVVYCLIGLCGCGRCGVTSVYNAWCVGLMPGVYVGV